MSEQRSNRISSGVIAAVSAAVVAASGGVALFTWNSSQSPPQDNPPQSTQKPSPDGTSRPNQQQDASIFWLKDNGTNLELVSQSLKISNGDKPNQILEKAFQTLLAGPTEGTGSTTIPRGTKLLSLKQENDTIYVNLSPAFTSGGGSASMMGRLGQVIYTATSLNPNAKVYIQVDGKKLKVLGGEGVEVDQPMTRTAFKQNYPL
ncbi:GerMN domain-containing protein [Calothrix rhizosoleniae]|uniref:GerMN domain-containing protein n=1 Tax=Calothrix rhizosoleniae TaxID=888997 RepID=UPI000B498F93|nr:GerMN domain-containing protein [Calothrix rhizosoleniae]